MALTMMEKLRRKSTIKGRAEKLNPKPLSLIVGYKRPMTLSESILRIMEESEDYEAFERQRGFEYDYQDDNEIETFDENDYEEKDYDPKGKHYDTYEFVKVEKQNAKPTNSGNGRGNQPDNRHSGGSEKVTNNGEGGDESLFTTESKSSTTEN